MHSPKQWCFIKCIEHSKTIQNCGVFYRLWRSRETSPKSLSPIAVNQVLNTVSLIQSSWICRKQVVCFNYAYIQSRSKYIITICCFCNPLLCLDSWVVLWLLARISDSYPSEIYTNCTFMKSEMLIQLIVSSYHIEYFVFFLTLEI